MDRLQFKKDQKVYCNCYVGNKEDHRAFLCRGVITDILDKKIMRVLVTGVNTTTLGDPVSNRILKTLLGKTVPRNQDQVHAGMSDIAAKLYSQGKWLSWDEDKIKRIVKAQKEKRKDEQPRKDSSDGVPRVDHQRREKNRKVRARPGNNPVHAAPATNEQPGTRRPPNE